MIGDYPSVDSWIGLNYSKSPVIDSFQETYQVGLSVYPNDNPYPTSSIPQYGVLSLDDTRTIYTSIYGSAVIIFWYLIYEI